MERWRQDKEPFENVAETEAPRPRGGHVCCLNDFDYFEKAHTDCPLYRSDLVRRGRMLVKVVQGRDLVLPLTLRRPSSLLVDGLLYLQ
jgi:hypothetical protein